MQYLLGEDEIISLQRQAGLERTTQPHPQTDNFAYVIPVDTILHSDESPFCFADPTCPCRENQEALEQVAQWIQDGLLTKEEATSFVAGKTV